MDFYPKDTVILKQDGIASEYLHIIKKGGVKITIRSEAGEEILIDYRGEGETYGLISLMGENSMTINCSQQLKPFAPLSAFVSFTAS